MANGATTYACSDKAAWKAWKEIMEIATRHCLIMDAAGGVAILAVPEEQRKCGARERVLAMCVRLETTEIGQ